ncbi:MAG: hypothetical protein FRX49_02334 [Trebouxia sp. A1-2]|nr:MAG: hypothetical protein FRX49_02334 [Trebouxia sp. A1-2]
MRAEDDMCCLSLGSPISLQHSTIVDGMGWDGMGWDGMGWDGMGWDGMGWDGMGKMRTIACLLGSTNQLILPFYINAQREMELSDSWCAKSFGLEQWGKHNWQAELHHFYYQLPQYCWM